jgi:hypothetical protein
MVFEAVACHRLDDHPRRRDQPLDRVLVARSRKLAYVAAKSVISSGVTDELGGVGFPSNCVFKFDEELFQSLSDAWREGDRSRLTILWEKARPIGNAADEG